MRDTEGIDMVNPLERRAFAREVRTVVLLFSVAVCCKKTAMYRICKLTTCAPASIRHDETISTAAKNEVLGANSSTK